MHQILTEGPGGQRKTLWRINTYLLSINPFTTSFFSVFYLWIELKKNLGSFRAEEANVFCTKGRSTGISRYGSVILCRHWGIITFSKKTYFRLYSVQVSVSESEWTVVLNSQISQISQNRCPFVFWSCFWGSQLEFLSPDLSSARLLLRFTASSSVALPSVTLFNRTDKSS